MSKIDEENEMNWQTIGCIEVNNWFGRNVMVKMVTMKKVFSMAKFEMMLIWFNIWYDGNMRKFENWL